MKMLSIYYFGDFRLEFPFPALVVGHADDITLVTWDKDTLLATHNLCF